jgi:glucokinase
VSIFSAGSQYQWVRGLTHERRDSTAVTSHARSHESRQETAKQSFEVALSQQSHLRLCINGIQGTYIQKNVGSNMACYAGVDLGATNVRAVVGDRSGAVLGADTRETPQSSSGIEVTEAVLDALRGACAAADAKPGEITRAGIGSVGPLDRAQGVVRDPANLPDSIDVIPLTGPVENLVDAPVFLHNDANAGVLGERFYADHNPDNMLYLTVSSGIGAGVIVDGTVLSGWDGNAGEVGHVTVDSDRTMRCGCGRRGHWEAYCSGSGIPRYAEQLHGDEETALPLYTDEFTAADVFALAGEDAFADRVLDRVADWNAQGVATLVHAYAPMIVYVGGAVALNNPDTVLDGVRERLPSLVMTNVPDIQPTTLGDDVVVRGALASAITNSGGSEGRRPRETNPPESE